MYFSIFEIFMKKKKRARWFCEIIVCTLKSLSVLSFVLIRRIARKAKGKRRFRMSRRRSRPDIFQPTSARRIFSLNRSQQTQWHRARSGPIDIHWMQSIDCMLRANERIPCIMHSWDILQSHSTPKPRFGAHREQASEHEKERERGGEGACVYVCVTQHASCALCVYLIIIITTSQSCIRPIAWQPSTLLIRTASCGLIDMIRYEIIDVFRYIVSRYVWCQ